MFRPNKIPLKAHPFVRKMFVEMNKQYISLVEMGEKSGVHRHTLKNWRVRSQPRLADIEACYNVLGMKLVITGIQEV